MMFQTKKIKCFLVNISSFVAAEAIIQIPSFLPLHVGVFTLVYARQMSLNSQIGPSRLNKCILEVETIFDLTRFFVVTVQQTLGIFVWLILRLLYEFLHDLVQLYVAIFFLSFFLFSQTFTHF